FVDASRNTVYRADEMSAAYRLALRHAEEAAGRLEGDSVREAEFLVGAAHYRLGQYQEALGTLERVQSTSPAVRGRGGTWVAGNLAFLAMTRHRLGQKEQAHAARQQLRKVLRKFDAATPERALEREVEAIINGSAAAPKK